MDHQLLEGYNQMHYDGDKDAVVDQELKVLYELTGEETELSIDSSSAWENFQSQIESQTVHRSLNFNFLKVAAVIIITCGLGLAGYFFVGQSQNGPEMIAFENSGSSTESLLLPDGSQVWLRQGTRITYARGFDNREVSFDGEGYFDITKGQGTFTIATGDGLSITVLGTEFGVNTTNANTVVQVTEGRVALSAGANSLEITAGETGVYRRSKEQILKSSNNATNALAWKTGHFKFDDLPLSEAIELLQSFYPDEIVLQDSALGTCRVTGEFKDQSLSDILEDICFVLSLKVEKSNNSYLLSGEGC